MGETFIKWISNLNKNDVKIAGTKAANLGEIYRKNLPVPQAFVVTTDAFLFFMRETNLGVKIKELLNKISFEDQGEIRKVCEEIKGMILSSKMPGILERDISQAYDEFNIDLDGLKNSPGALAILKSAREPIFVSVRSSSPIVEESQTSFAGQHDTFTNIKGNDDLIFNIKKVFASSFSTRSLFYRKLNGLSDIPGIAVIVQRMINSEKSGIVFSQNPIIGDDSILIESIFGLGEGIVSGKIKPDKQILSRDLEITDEEISFKKYAIIRNASGQNKIVEIKDELAHERVLKIHELKSLAEYAIKLEGIFNAPQNMEFAIENKEIFILQTRPITTMGLIKEFQDFDGQILSSGFGASGGISRGIVKIVHSVDDFDKIKEGDILVTTFCNQEIINTTSKAKGIITEQGAIGSNACIISRERSIPMIVGALNILEVVQDGMEVTVDGFLGKVFTGSVQNKSKEVLPIIPTRNTKVKVVIDLPKFAKSASKVEASGVGLVKLEGMICANGKHPLEYEKENKLEEYSDGLNEGIKKISEEFNQKEIWVRTSDIKSDECNNIYNSKKINEKNPKLGIHGIRFSLKHEGIFRAELRALKSLSDRGHKIGVLIPRLTNVIEMNEAKRIFNEEGCERNMKFGIVVETPAAATMIHKFCDLRPDLVLIGIKNLTELILATDKDNEDAMYLYDEMNEAVLKQISRVLMICKDRKIESSAYDFELNPLMIKFLVENKINSITVEVDDARNVSEIIAENESIEREVENKTRKIKEDKKEKFKERVEQKKEVVKEKMEIKKEVEKVLNKDYQKITDNKRTIEEIKIESKDNEIDKINIQDEDNKGEEDDESDEEEIVIEGGFIEQIDNLDNGEIMEGEAEIIELIKEDGEGTKINEIQEEEKEVDDEEINYENEIIEIENDKISGEAEILKFEEEIKSLGEEGSKDINSIKESNEKNNNQRKPENIFD